MRACEKWSRPPSAMLGGTEWGERDHLLVFAYQRYLDTTCPECGGYVVECRNPDNRGVYEVDRSAYCYRKQALEEVTRAEKFDPEHGQLFSVREIDESIVRRAPLTLQRGEDAHSEAGEDEQHAQPGECEWDEVAARHDGHNGEQ